MGPQLSQARTTLRLEFRTLCCSTYSSLRRSTCSRLDPCLSRILTQAHPQGTPLRFSSHHHPLYCSCISYVKWPRYTTSLTSSSCSLRATLCTPYLLHFKQAKKHAARVQHTGMYFLVINAYMNTVATRYRRDVPPLSRYLTDTAYTVRKDPTKISGVSLPIDKI